MLKKKSYVIRQLQIKTMRSHYKPTRMAKIQNSVSSNADENVGEQELSLMAGGNTKWFSHCGRHFGSFSHN